mmetsp:Transcript_40356/g.63015  ORF Transcript_40356/g.63015 Transcript_40356/m.63015 type:complete len:89 (+) Transcript_40356:351-617(+)
MLPVGVCESHGCCFSGHQAYHEKHHISYPLGSQFLILWETGAGSLQVLGYASKGMHIMKIAHCQMACVFPAALEAVFWSLRVQLMALG